MRVERVHRNRVIGGGEGKDKKRELEGRSVYARGHGKG